MIHFDTFFVDCPHVAILWKKIKSLTNTISQCSINFETLDILLGIPNYTNDDILNMFNFIILYAKFYITKSRQQNMKPETDIFKKRLKERITIEKLLALESNCYKTFQNKWESLFNLLKLDF